MAHVELTVPPLAAHVRTARLVVLAAARRAGHDDAFVDELRLAVGEACARAVGLHLSHAPGTPVRVVVVDDPTGLTISVADCGPAAGPTSDDLSDHLLAGADDADDLIDPDVALAILAGMVDDYDVQATDAGTIVTMRWPLTVRPVGTSGPGATAVSQA
jgi:anti-sigma regulatory factor (Ser/Thr protein kinase)